MLAFPENYHFYTKYAEVLYTIGGLENIKLAKKVCICMCGGCLCMGCVCESVCVHVYENGEWFLLHA